jgi:hypothetical protein
LSKGASEEVMKTEKEEFWIAHDWLKGVDEYEREFETWEEIFAGLSI